MDKAFRNLRTIMEMLACYGMASIYALLLAVARSARHLEELHMALPPNQRLLRDDFVRLRDCRQATGVIGGNQLGLAETIMLLEVVKAGKNPNLTDYYRDVLDAGRPEMTREQLGVYTLGSRLVLSCEERGGHGYEHFLVRLAGHQFKLGCRFVQGKFVIRLVTHSRELIEELTFRLLSIPALKQSFIVGDSGGTHGRTYSGDGSEVDFWFVVDGARFQEPSTFIITKHGDHIANLDIFLPELAKVLHEFQLPFEGLMGIVPWSDDCVLGTRFQEGRSGTTIWGGAHKY